MMAKTIMSTCKFWIPLFLLGCSSAGVIKIDDNLYSVSEKSQPTQAEADHVPDPAIDEINKAAKDYCDQNQLKVKVLSLDRPTDPMIRQENYKLTFSCIPVSQPTPSTPSPNALRLQELKSLRDQGVITQEQFDRKRTEILNQM